MAKSLFPIPKGQWQRIINLFGLLCGLFPFVSYLFFILSVGQGPIDYETFMAIGERLIQGKQVYGENSYYPLPYVMIFALFRLLPKPLNVFIWFCLPVIMALYIARWKPWVLFFAPLYSHFVGGQSSLFGMLAAWGYRRNSQTHKIAGGVFLALALLKPQLALFPTLYAFSTWIKEIHFQKKIPSQFLAWVSTALILYAPAFVLYPQWLGDWLQAPRPFFERALAGLVPRILVSAQLHPTLLWLLLLIITLIIWVSLLVYVKSMPFDVWMIGSFIINPFVHDYDLIQLIPFLHTKKEQIIAVLASIPGWLTILLAYQNDQAWFTFTLIAPALLWVKTLEERHQAGH
ncbi:MAG: hypothetical protein ACK44E_05875 [Anaerolineales bacterium]